MAALRAAVAARRPPATLRPRAGVVLAAATLRSHAARAAVALAAAALRSPATRAAATLRSHAARAGAVLAGAALRSHAAQAGVVLAVAVLMGACGKPPDLAPPRPRPSVTASPSPSVRPTEATTPPITSVPTGAPTTSVPSPTGTTAVDCAGRPGAGAVLAVLRRADIVTAGNARVVTGPLCAGGWQWSVVRVPDADPLQVVTRGSTGSLRLVTAGTDVCNAEMQATAPAGIRAAACDARPPGR